MSRRLPVYVLLDTSGSMKGEPIESVKNGLASLVASLRTDPHALDTVNLCLMTFDREVRTLVPLTPLDEFILPELVVPESGPTMTGLALREVCGEEQAGRRSPMRPAAVALQSCGHARHHGRQYLPRLLPVGLVGRRQRQRQRRHLVRGQSPASASRDQLGLLNRLSAPCPPNL